MPRFVATAARRNATRPTAAALRAPRAVSTAEAFEDYLEAAAEDAAAAKAADFAADRPARAQARKERAAREGRALLFEQGHAALQAALPEVRFGRTVRTGGGRPDYVDDSIQVVARQAGWMRAVATGDYPLLLRFIKKTNRRGAFGGDKSPVTVAELAKAFPSPGKASRYMAAVRHRANAVLNAYTGQPRVAWHALGRAIIAERGSVGKAAILAVALMFGLIGRYEKPTYRTAREALIDLHLSHPVVRKDDGISSRIGREPVLVEGDIAAYAAKFSGEGRVSLDRSGWLVVAGNRSFHVQHGRYREVEAESAISQARKGWERQDELRRYQAERAAEAEAQAKAKAERIAEMVAFLNGSATGYCPLISREDSYQAGNCQPGTEEWVLQRGWRRKTFIAGLLLIPHLSDWRVERVVYAAMARRKDYAEAT